MILDLRKFIKQEQPYWDELAGILDQLEKATGSRLDLARLKRFHYLYQRASTDLGKLATFSSEPNMRVYLESLVGRAYGEIHETREKPHRLAPLRWFFTTFPRTFRKHIIAFAVSLLAMFIGFSLGGFVILIDPDAKESLIGFSHLEGDPSERVAKEENTDRDRLSGKKSSFSSFLMTHNTKVSIFTLALGMTYGIGTIIMLFYNGVILGAIAVDYILAGETWFLFGWLLPHGSIEIPAILLAGQAGLALAGALIGWGTPLALRSRLRKVSNDLVTLIFGVSILLVWAGIVEAFFSQYHEPVIPYTFKIGFGVVELILLTLFLSMSGKKNEEGR
ncbi:MAG: stage II sporulation protein M [Desulfobacterales bacterium]|nr:stage II sporulation protein M [Deltaproteobacteria bacterium]NNL42699.1 stage II sporulation protein M [Desulfobacterales bacterium]